MTDHAKRWHALLSTGDAGACATLAERMRAGRLTFGGRLLCPFLRPFFLDATDEARVRTAAETLWRLGERVATAALADRTLIDDLALTDAEIRLSSIDPRYSTTSTAARADAFILPGSLQFAEYNAESPAGLAYTEGLGEVFLAMPEMRRFQQDADVRMYRPVDHMRQALLDSYREWGGTAASPTVAIVDWREVPTYTEFELLRDAFTAAGTPTIVCDPRDLEFAGGTLTGGGRKIDLVYRRVLINDIIAREDECRALIAAYERGAVCVANSLRCKIPHKKAFFAVLTDERRASLFGADEGAVIRNHVPWTALLRDRPVRRDGREIDLLEHVRSRREQLVIKPNDEYGGSGVTLGWETTAAEWDAAIERAIGGTAGAWVVQEKIHVRRETFPMCVDSGVEMRDMLVDFAPYLFRGRLAGFLTRLSTTGLANVTSGGGQVPAFVVEGKIA